MHCLTQCGVHLYSLEKQDEDLKAEVKGFKDTLSCEQDKLKALQAKYNNFKDSLKSARSELAKAKE